MDNRSSHRLQLLWKREQDRTPGRKHSHSPSTPRERRSESRISTTACRQLVSWHYS